MTLTGIATIDEIVRRMMKHNPFAVYLFGSYAYGTPNSDSDIDFMVISSEPAALYYKKIMRDLWDIEQPIEMLVFSEDSVKEKMSWNPMISKIVNEGKVLYGKSIK